MTAAGKFGMAVLWATVSQAQHVVGARAGTVHFTTGIVTVDGQPVDPTPLHFPLLKEGQTVRTGKGRVEILLSPAVFLRLGEEAELRMLSTRLEDAQVELLKGTSLVEVVEAAHGDRVRIRAGSTET